MSYRNLCIPNYTLLILIAGHRGEKLEVVTLHAVSQKQHSVDHFIIDTCSDEVYYCEDCGNDFDSIESYNEAHNGPNSCRGSAESTTEVTLEPIEIKEEADFDDNTIEMESIEEDIIEELDDTTEPQLWEVLEDDDNELVPPPETNEAEVIFEETVEVGEMLNKSERYFCFDCHSIFETRQSAEEHSCPQNEANGAKKNNAKLAKTQTPVRRKLTNDPSAGNNSSTTICHICKTKFSSAKCLKFHMRIHNKRTSKSIQDALPVGAHQQYSELDQFYCEICNKRFVKSTGISSYMFIKP